MTEVVAENEIIETVQENTQTGDNEERKWCVYCHTNKTNNKKYFGITSKNPPEKRWGANGTKYKPRNKNGKSHFWNAIIKYGWDNFRHEVLFKDLYEWDACKIEIDLIAQFDTTNPNKGYNLDLGGTSGRHSIEARKHMSENHADVNGPNNPFYGKRHSKETKAKLRQSHIGKYVGENSPKYGTHPSKETRRKMSEAQKNRKPPTDITRQKMSKQRTGFKNGAATKPMYCIELNEIFWGATEAKNKYGFNDNAIRASAKNIKIHAGKHPETKVPLSWKYVYDQINKNGTITQGAVSLGYITEKQVDEYFNNLKQKGND